MFTGIIEAVGTVSRVEPLEGGRRLTFTAPFAHELRVDQSVAVQGACLTVVAHDERSFSAIAVEETLSKTTLGALREGDGVNLERALLPSSRLDGHFVQGHVDATGEVLSVETLGTSWLYRIMFDRRFASYLIPVGSITVDGVSLTVARLEDEAFTVSIIPHTFERTTVRDWTPGRRVNLEFDLLGKYVARRMAFARVED